MKTEEKFLRNKLSFERDVVYVEQEPGMKKYVTLSEYLKSLEDKHDRVIEKAKIEKLVDW